METLTHCPVCNSTQFEPYTVCQDYLVSQQKFSIQTCQSCGFRTTNPRPDAASIGLYYKSDQYVSHNDSGGGLVNTAYRLVRGYTLRSKLSLVNQLNQGTGRILDVGCGTGAFLETCRAGGWQITGTEPDADARKIASEKLRIDVESNIGALNEHVAFDIITLWHVLEHIPDLNETIATLHRLLNQFGTLLIAVPNSDSYDAQYFGKYWAAYDVPRHLHHFTPKTIRPLFAKHGFTVVEQRPMLFDAFYIGLLSTHYQMGQTDYVKSVRVGFASNQAAHKTGHYSSLIYVLKKVH